MSLRRCLLEIDVPGACVIWAKTAPHLPQPVTHAEALASLHHARTQAQSMPIKARAYSHRWLLDHGLPSGLPDHLKPRADRLYPAVVEGVGIAVVAGSSLTKPVAGLVQQAMSEAVAECYADGRKEMAPARMIEAKAATLKKLLGV